MLQRFLLSIFMLFFIAACGSTPKEESAASGAGELTSVDYTSDGIKAGSADDLIVNVGDRVFFEFDSSELTVDAQATLDAQAAWLMQYPDTNITVEGHADERGTREYNLALGDKRAFSVYSYLAQAGIDTNRMEYVSWGKERPEVIGSDETAYSQNRRGVTLVSN